MKKFVAAIAAIGMSAPVAAADLKGPTNAIGDLEERVAELEATVAKKGNRKVSLTIYGQVHAGILWADVPGLGEQRGVVLPGNDVSRFGLRGESKFGEAKAGFTLEIGLKPTDLTGVPAIVQNREDLEIRHASVFVAHDKFGTVTIGQTSTATDGIAEISVANTAIAAPLMSLEPLSSASLLGLNSPMDGGRAQGVRYTTPTFGGFAVSASYFGSQSFLATEERQGWDAALRYAGEFSAFRMAAGIGYREEDKATLFMNAEGVKTLAASASLMHVPSGVFVSGAYGFQQDGVVVLDTILGGIPLAGFEEMTQWHAQAGIERNWTGWGTTTLYGEYADIDIKGVAAGKMYGLGVVQAVDALGLDMYAAFREYQDDLEARSIVVGTRVKF